MWRSVPGVQHDEMPRSSDVLATRSAADRPKLRERPACVARLAPRRFGALGESSAELVYMTGALCARLSRALLNRMGCSSIHGLVPCAKRFDLLRSGLGCIYIRPVRGT